MQTLRIGLLSFTKFLNPNNNPILDNFLQNYREDPDWLIWLTLIEMMMSTPDSWAFPHKPEVKAFYKSVSLKKGWSNVIKEINKPENKYLLSTFEHFIFEMNE